MSPIPLEDALATVDRAMAGHRVETEEVAVIDAAGRVLAQDQASRLDLPPFDKAAMDGYAVLANDQRDTYRVLETVPAGRVPVHALEPGTATKIMTGAPVPRGAGLVVMVEDTDAGEETVRVFHHRGSANICRQGEDVRVGQIVMRAGDKLGALDIANLISCGIESVQVRRRVRVAIFATGDEIVDSFAALQPGNIMDSNGPMLLALARDAGLEVVQHEHVADDRAVLVAVILAAAERADLILLSGGVSAGDYDFVPEALGDAGFTIHVDSVAVKPGKPVTFATRPGCAALGMPGNPVSVFLGFHLYVRRIAAHLSGAEPPLRSFPVPLAKDLTRKHAERTGLVPAVLDREGRAEIVPYHGSAHLLALRNADGFLEIPAGVTQIPARETARFYPLALGRW